MQFFKLAVSTVAMLVVSASAAAIQAPEAEGPTQAEKEKYLAQVEKLEKFQLREKGESPLGIPADMQERMRQIMSGEGDFSIPSGKDGLSHLSKEDRAFFNSRAEQVEAYTQELREQGVLDVFEKDHLDENMESYWDVAQEIGDHSVSSLETALQEHAGVSAEDAAAFNGANQGMPQSRQNEEEEFAVFASFSMGHRAIREAVLTAKRHGAEVYFNGLHPDHSKIDETMMLMREIAQGIENPPMVRFNPTGFTKYGVTQVPTILYRKDDRHIQASGILSLDWLKEEFAHHDTNQDYGVSGPVSEVAERNLIEEMQERMAAIDWEGERDRTLSTFWERQNYTRLPRAEDDEAWMIDPTIQATNDVKTPRGEVVATAGQVINPLANQSQGLTVVVFNAGDIEQVQWVTSKLNTLEVSGTLMLLTSEVSKDSGWDHIEALYEHFEQPVYLLPEEMVKRFHISALPAIVSTDLQRSLLKVEQFNINKES
jgi:conjugal transfer pilus assembly protein TraW